MAVVLYENRQSIDETLKLFQQQEEIRKSTNTLSFDDVMRVNTGRFMQPSIYAKNKKADAVNKALTERIAKKLERAGIEVQKESNMTLVTDVTKLELVIPNYRNIVFLPTQAQKNRRQMQMLAEYFLQREKYWRYAVITFGERVTIDEFEQTWADAKQRLNEWRKKMRRKHKIEFALVGWEFTVDKNETYHIHANVVYRPPFFADGGKAFRKDTSDHFGAWWNDAGQLKNAAEVVKYSFKPTEISRVSDDNLPRLFNATFNKRFFEVLGDMAKLRAKLNKDGKKFTRVGGRVRTRYKEEIFPSAETPGEEAEEQQTRDPKNIIVARVPPSFHTMWAEGATLVMNYTPDAIGEKAQERLLEVRRNQFEARAYWDAMGAPAPATALAMAQAAEAAEADDVDCNVRALWNSDTHLYNLQRDDKWETISMINSDMADFFDDIVFDDDDPPPNVVQFADYRKC